MLGLPPKTGTYPSPRCLCRPYGSPLRGRSSGVCLGMVRMKPKMQPQVQPWEIAPPRSADGHIIPVEVEEEIQNFLHAVNSYPSRVAKEPGVTFQQHLSSIFAPGKDRPEADRRDSRPRRH